jgi:hypothetical protein
MFESTLEESTFFLHNPFLVHRLHGGTHNILFYELQILSHFWTIQAGQWTELAERRATSLATVWWMLVPWWSLLGCGRLCRNSICVPMNIFLMPQGFIYFSAARPNPDLICFRPRSLMGRFNLNFSLEVSGCRQGTPVLYLEHVQVVTTIRYAKRGDLMLTLYSPRGTRSVLLPPRPQASHNIYFFNPLNFQDFNQNGFHKVPFC